LLQQLSVQLAHLIFDPASVDHLSSYDSGVISGLLQMEPFKEEFGSYYDYNIVSTRAVVGCIQLS